MPESQTKQGSSESHNDSSAGGTLTEMSKQSDGAGAANDNKNSLFIGTSNDQSITKLPSTISTT